MNPIWLILWNNVENTEFFRSKLGNFPKYHVCNAFMTHEPWGIDHLALLSNFTIMILPCRNTIFYFILCNDFDFKPFLYYKLNQKTQDSFLQSNNQVKKNTFSYKGHLLDFWWTMIDFLHLKVKWINSLWLQNDVEQGLVITHSLQK